MKRYRKSGKYPLIQIVRMNELLALRDVDKSLNTVLAINSAYAS